MVDEQMVKRYFEINEQLKVLQEQRDLLNKQIKSDMLESDINKAIVGRFLVEISTQDRSKFDNSIVSFLRDNGMVDLIIETFDEKKLKERIKLGKLSTDKLEKYKIKNIIHVLHVNPS